MHIASWLTQCWFQKHRNLVAKSGLQEGSRGSASQRMFVSDRQPGLSRADPIMHGKWSRWHSRAATLQSSDTPKRFASTDLAVPRLTAYNEPPGVLIVHVTMFKIQHLFNVQRDNILSTNYRSTQMMVLFSHFLRHSPNLCGCKTLVDACYRCSDPLGRGPAFNDWLAHAGVPWTLSQGASEIKFLWWMWAMSNFSGN